MEGLAWHSEEPGHCPLGDGLPFEQGNKMVTLAFYYFWKAFDMGESGGCDGPRLEDQVRQGGWREGDD